MIRRFFAVCFVLAWGLWFGGVGALLLFVMRLFAVNRELAIQAAPELFKVFQIYQIILAALALIGVVGWRMATNSGAVAAIFGTMIVPILAAGLGPFLFAQRMIQLWSVGKSSSPEFQMLHHRSEMVYSVEGIALLVVGVLLPWALNKSGGRVSKDSEHFPQKSML